MLERLTVTDLAVVGQASLEFGPGLTIVSGETGAGKSLLLGAIGLIAGERGSGGLVRSGAKRARVEAVFVPDDPAGINALLQTLGLRELAEEWLIIRREIGADGRSRAFVGDEQVLIATLRTLGPVLIDLHGQSEGQQLLKPGRQRDCLDELAKLFDKRSRLAELVATERSLTERLNAHRAERERIAEQRDFYTHQLEEIDRAELRPGEDQSLRKERALMLQSEQVSESVQTLLRSLEDSEGSAAADVASASDALARLAALDPDLKPLYEMLEAARIEIVEVARTVRVRFDDLDFRPERRDEVEARLDLLARFKRKYGESLEDVLDYGERLRRQLDADATGEGDERALSDEREAVRSDAAGLADGIGRLRERAAKKLSRAVEKELPSLGMKGARFAVEVRTTVDPDGWYHREGRPTRLSGGGAEEVTFLLAANPGQPPGPLARVASGGELSRVMLAIKSNLAETTPSDVMVFDEVDSGVGGRTARAVGARIQRIASTRQVVAITHLASVACLGDRHYRVDKETKDGRSHVQVELLSEESRIGEIARLLSGGEKERTARAHARELLATSGGGSRE